MFRPAPSRALMLACAGTALWSAAMFGVLHSAPVHTGIPKAATARQVADILDGMIQPRFQDDRAGVFGLSRIVTPEQLAGVGGHQGLAVLQPKTLVETWELRQAQASGRNYVVAFLHCAHVPGQFKGIRGLPSASGPEVKPYLRLLATRPSSVAAFAQQAQTVPLSPRPQAVLFSQPHLSSADDAAISQEAIASLPSLRAGARQETSVGNWLVEMRPVPAAHASCLGCHVGAPHNETLGVMVYAVSKKPGASR